MGRKALGKGLEALIPDYPLLKDGETELIEVEISQVTPNPYQPRGDFGDDMDELVASIREKGILQPVVVCREGDSYQLVVGERRLKAAKMAGLFRIPALLVELDSPGEMLELALVENLQRKDLNPIEEAQAYQRLMEERGFTQAQISERVGKERSSVANSIRLLRLPTLVQDYLVQGRMTSGQARPLLGLDDEEKQVELARKIVEEGVSARRVEGMIRPRRRRARREPEEILALEGRLREMFGTGVRIIQGKGKGRIEIEFYSKEDLERILEVLGLSSWEL